MFLFLPFVEAIPVRTCLLGRYAGFPACLAGINVTFQRSEHKGGPGEMATKDAFRREPFPHSDLNLLLAHSPLPSSCYLDIQLSRGFSQGTEMCTQTTLISEGVRFHIFSWLLSQSPYSNRSKT